MGRAVRVSPGSGSDHDSASPGERDADLGPEGTPGSRWLRPVAVGSVLTVVCLPLGGTLPRRGLDPSWQLGLSLVHLRGIAAGPGFVFTFGPLGFLAHPNIVWLPGAVAGLIYVVATTFALYFLVCRSLLDWLSPIAAAALTAALALVTVQVGTVQVGTVVVGTVPELATAALILWALTLIRPGLVTTPLPGWVPSVLGGVAALQLLVKFGTGGAALGAALVVGVARPPRLKNVAVLTASFLVSLLALWLVAQQSPADITEWLRGSFQAAAGYSSALALLAGFAGSGYWLVWLVAVGVLLFGAGQLVRKNHARAIPFVALLGVAVWFFTKEGFTRLDAFHATIAFLGFGVLIAAIPWERRQIPLGLFGLAFALVAILATGDFATRPSQLPLLATQPSVGISEAVRIVRSTLGPSYRSSELNAARRSLQAYYRIPNTVLMGLRGGRVHADPTEIAAVWAYGLRWQPVPVFQTYAAFTTSLDQVNADSLRSGDGPNAVIRQLGAFSLGRIAAWESPNYMVTLTCNYEMTAQTRRWEALLRRSDACGRPRRMSQKVLRTGESVLVPNARNRNDLVVATFDYPRSVIERLGTSLLKPSRLPIVLTGGQMINQFVVGTASQFHLLRVPETIGGRHITNSRLDIRSLSFPNSEHAVTVRFYELSTR